VLRPRTVDTGTAASWDQAPQADAMLHPISCRPFGTALRQPLPVYPWQTPYRPPRPAFEHALAPITAVSIEDELTHPNHTVSFLLSRIVSDTVKACILRRGKLNGARVLADAKRMVRAPSKAMTRGCRISGQQLAFPSRAGRPISPPAKRKRQVTASLARFAGDVRTGPVRLTRR
jgi:hypothetical protein